MVSLVKSWFAPGANPVGIDLGASRLRMAQVEKVDGEFQLIAAASAEVPAALSGDFAGRLRFYAGAIGELWTRGNFRGRRAVFCFPADLTHVQHLRLPAMEPSLLARALSWEAQDKLPFSAADAALRHVVAGEIYHDNSLYNEVILMAARKTEVEQILSAAEKARLDVVGMNVQPRAILDCFLNIYRRKTDADAVNCFVDIGCHGSRVVVTQGPEILFARNIPQGAQSLGGEQAPDQPAVARLMEELSLCRLYHDTTFPRRTIGRLIFIGGKAHDRDLCLRIARGLSLEAIIGDPLVRLGRGAQISPESGIDRRQAQPSWALAIGLSMGAPQRVDQRKLAS